jgi:inosine-uridine nucleoside N-ribohydrolase
LRSLLPVDSTVLTTETLHVTVETSGTATLGQTVVDEREHFRLVPATGLADRPGAGESPG